MGREDELKIDQLNKKSNFILWGLDPADWQGLVKRTGNLGVIWRAVGIALSTHPHIVMWFFHSPSNS
jgi:hypothetical protein